MTKKDEQDKERTQGQETRTASTSKDGEGRIQEQKGGLWKKDGQRRYT